MSWYPKNLVVCPRCGTWFTTPIDCLGHRRNKPNCEPSKRSLAAAKASAARWAKVKQGNA